MKKCYKKELVMARSTHVLVLLLVGIMTLTASFNIYNAQEKQKIPAEFLTGKWMGTISGYAHYHDHGKPPTSRTVNFSIDWISASGAFGGEAIINPWKTKGVGHLMFLGNVAPNAPIVEKGITYYVSPFFINFGFEFSESELVPLTDQYILTLWFMALIDHTKSNNRIDLEDNIIFINHKQENKCPECGGVSIALVFSGEIYRVNMKRLVFPKDIKPNEPIKTDKKTQLEITMPDVGLIKVAPNTETKINCSVCWLDAENGRIHSVIKKLKPKTKFDVRTPTATTGVRGTEYVLSVEDDGTTTVVVLDGEVEFSDNENRKTVIVKKNQKSVVKPGALPIEPEEIDPGKILKWWE